MNAVMSAVMVALAGGLGATLRFVIDVSIPAQVRTRFPWGTFAINVSGSFILGLVAGPLATFAWGPIVTVGLLGGYTTFSAASLETVSLLEDRRWGKALLYGFGSLVLCAVAALLGAAVSS